MSMCCSICNSNLHTTGDHRQADEENWGCEIHQDPVECKRLTLSDNHPHIQPCECCMSADLKEKASK